MSCRLICVWQAYNCRRFATSLREIKANCVLPDGVRHEKLTGMRPDADLHGASLGPEVLADFEFGCAITSPSADAASKVGT
jgi:hypothetical protein